MSQSGPKVNPQWLYLCSGEGYLILVYTVHSMACFAHIIRVTSPFGPRAPPKSLKSRPYMAESF